MPENKANEIERTLQSTGWHLMLDKLKEIVSHDLDVRNPQKYFIDKNDEVVNINQLAYEKMFEWMSDCFGEIQLRDFQQNENEDLEIYKIKK